MISSLGKPNGEGEGNTQYCMPLSAEFLVWFCQCLKCALIAHSRKIVTALI